MNHLLKGLTLTYRNCSLLNIIRLPKNSRLIEFEYEK